MSSLPRRRTGPGLRSSNSLGRTPSLGGRPKHFYCTVFGQMDTSQTNLAVVLRTYFYPREEMVGSMKHVEERWDDNASFKIVCNHEVNSGPPSVMLCNPVCLQAKPGAQFKIDLLNQEAFLDTSEFFVSGPQLPKCLQFDISLESYNVTGSSESTTDLVPSIKILRSPDEKQVAEIPLVHLCDIPDAAMTGSFAFDDFCYTIDPKPRFGVKCEHNRAWHRLPQLLIKFLTEDRGLASRVMDIGKEWEHHAGLQLIHIPQDSDRDAQIRIKFSSKNMSAIGTDAEDIPEDRPTMYLNVSRDTNPVLFRRRVLHQFGHALGLCHEFESVPDDVEWDKAGVKLDTSMEAGWTTEQANSHLFHKTSCSNNDNFDRLSIMTQTFKRSYVKGWLPRQHQSVLSVDDKSLIKVLYPPPHASHQWGDPLATPEPEEEDEEESEEEEQEEMTEWKRAAVEREREDMYTGVFEDQLTGRRFSDSEQPSTPPASVDRDGRGRRRRTEHSGGDMFEMEPRASGKKSLRPGTNGRFLEHEEVKYTKEELQGDTREGDFFSFRDQAVLREMEMPADDRLPTPLFSPPDTPDSIPDSLAPTPVSKLFLSDTFLDLREDWLNVNQEHMISLTQESLPGARRQKAQLHPGDVRFADVGDYEVRDVRGEKVQRDTYGIEHNEKELFGERTSVVSPAGIVEREQFFRTLGRLKTGEQGQEEVVSFAEQMEKMKREKDKQTEFFEPVRQFVGQVDIEGMGFDAPDSEPRQLRKQVEYEPDKKPKGKGKKKQLQPVEEEQSESFYNLSFRKHQEKELQEDPGAHFSFRDKLKNREYSKNPLKTQLAELEPADEDIFDLLDRASKEAHNFGRGKFVSSNQAPALISTKGSFAGIGGSGAFREEGWQSYYDYAEEDLHNYEYREVAQDTDMDLASFRQRLRQREGVALHEGVEITPAGNDPRNYLESPAPVANRSTATEDKINSKMAKNKAGRYYEDGIDMVSPNQLVDEALDRGFREGSEDEISREKKEAARRHYGIRRSPSDDDVARTKERIKAERGGKVSSSPEKHVKSRGSTRISQKDLKQAKITPSPTSQGQDNEGDSPFLPPITPKKHKPTSKSFVISKEIATQITADALIPQQPPGDYWVNKDTIISRPGDPDPYADLAFKAGPRSQRFYSGPEEERPRTFRSTFTDYEPPSEAYEKPKFEGVDLEEEEDRPNVYARLSDARTYRAHGQAVDVWTEKTDISFTVLLYLKKNLGINWKRAGQYLGISRERLRRIEDVGIANPKSGIEKMAQDMLFEWAEKDPQPTVAKLCAALEAADLSKLAGGVHDKVNKEKAPAKKPKSKKTRRKADPSVKVPVSEETIPYRVMVYLKDNLGESWKDVAICLKIPSLRVKSIEADAWQVEKMAYDMLHEWRQREKEHATVDKLIEALERAQCKKLVKGVQARCQSYHFRVAAN